MSKLKINRYYSVWKEKTNIVISLWEGDVQVGNVIVAIFKEGERKGEAFIWNLFVNKECRGKGYGGMLMKNAYEAAKVADCHTCVLEWELKDSPYWVFDWYCRLGYYEKEFGKGYSLMKMPIV